MFLLGTRIEGDVRTAHNPRFDIDESALPIGTALLAECVLKFLRRKRVKNLPLEADTLLKNPEEK